MTLPAIPDWSLLRSFLAVAETGSLSGAARALGASQPTLGRHIHTLEAQTGASLFTRNRDGYALTQAGRALIAPARSMRDAAAQVALAAAGQSDALAGTVRITCSMIFAHFHMPGLIASLRAAAPEIQVELVPSDRSENLLFREADIAVRMYRPEQLDMITKKLGEVEIGIFAHRDYVARHGKPRGLDDFEGHSFIGLDRSELFLRAMRDAGLSVRREDFALRCDDQAAAMHLLAAGCGIGFAQLTLARRFPQLQRILADVPVPSLPVWLTMPEALRHNPRIRFAFDHLAQGLSAICRA